MIDYMQNQRIEVLERTLAALTGGGSMAPFAPQPNAALVPTASSIANQQQNARIDTLESSVLALTNSVTLLNQQIANLTAELQRQTNVANMININPSTIDDSQNRRLDGIDNLVQTLSKDVSDYNQQMVDLITQYQSLKHRTSNARSNSSSHSSPGRASWF